MDAKLSIDEAEEIANQCLGKMIEHCDSVIILATSTQEGKSRSLAVRAGNIFATLGLLREYLEKDKAFTVGPILNPPKEND